MSGRCLCWWSVDTDAHDYGSAERHYHLAAAGGLRGRGLELNAYAMRSSGSGLDENVVASRFLAAITERSNEQLSRYVPQRLFVGPHTCRYRTEANEFARIYCIRHGKEDRTGKTRKSRWGGKWRSGEECRAAWPCNVQRIAISWCHH